MEQRTFGRGGFSTGIVGLGAWQLGADWGAVDDATALATIAAAVDAGVTFIDTADVYGDGRSERLIGQFLRSTDAPVTVATKMGRRVAQDPANYTVDNFRAWTDRSLANLGVIPALALPTRAAALGYLIGFGAGTVGAMTLFASLVGLASLRLALAGSRTWAGLLGGCGATSIAVGAYRLVLG